METILRMRFVINEITIIDEIMEDGPETVKLYNETLTGLQKEFKSHLFSELTMTKVKKAKDVESCIKNIVKTLRKKK